MTKKVLPESRRPRWPLIGVGILGVSGAAYATEAHVIAPMQRRQRQIQQRLDQSHQQRTQEQTKTVDPDDFAVVPVFVNLRIDGERSFPEASMSSITKKMKLIYKAGMLPLALRTEEAVEFPVDLGDYRVDPSTPLWDSDLLYRIGQEFRQVHGTESGRKYIFIVAVPGLVAEECGITNAIGGGSSLVMLQPAGTNGCSRGLTNDLIDIAYGLTAAHEIGHQLGLLHDRKPGDVMNHRNIGIDLDKNRDTYRPSGASDSPCDLEMSPYFEPSPEISAALQEEYDNLGGRASAMGYIVSGAKEIEKSGSYVRHYRTGAVFYNMADKKAGSLVGPAYAVYRERGGDNRYGPFVGTVSSPDGKRVTVFKHGQIAQSANGTISISFEEPLSKPQFLAVSTPSRLPPLAFTLPC